MADNENTTVRIVDIARMAGVSVATVDRVIHNRGKVSEENLARINEVLHAVNYRPNLIARSLASGRQYTLAVVMPRFAQGEYWAVTVFIDDTVTYNKADSPELARKGGEGIGRFQSQLADFTEPLAETIPGFHNIRHRFAQWDEALARELMLQGGKTLELHYREYFGALPWRGFTKFVVDSIVTTRPAPVDPLGIQPGPIEEPAPAAQL